MTKVAHVTVSLSHAGGGVALAVAELAGALAGMGTEVGLEGLEDGGAVIAVSPKVRVRTHPVERRIPLPRSREWTESLSSASWSLFHLHGLWSDASRFLPVLGDQGKIPRVVSPHGMLDPWALANSRWKKRLAARWFERANLAGAACVHALCESEKASIRAYGLKNPVAVIPNGVAVPEILKTEKRKAETKTLLFLGRLHPKKGLVNALKAWAKVLKTENCKLANSAEWRFVIAGWDQGGHEDELKRLCRELDLAYGGKDEPDGSPASVVFHGAAFGEEKEALLHQADAFILPSFSEGLPMAVLEAWAHGLPVLMTEPCNLPEGFSSGAAFRMATDAEGIGEGLVWLKSVAAEERNEMGRRGRTLVEERFTWPQVAGRMKSLYEWVLGGGPVPDFVDP